MLSGGLNACLLLPLRGKALIDEGLADLISLSVLNPLRRYFLSVAFLLFVLWRVGLLLRLGSLAHMRLVYCLFHTNTTLCCARFRCGSCWDALCNLDWLRHSVGTADVVGLLNQRGAFALLISVEW